MIVREQIASLIRHVTKHRVAKGRVEFRQGIMVLEKENPFRIAHSECATVIITRMSEVLAPKFSFFFISRGY